MHRRILATAAAAFLMLGPDPAAADPMSRTYARDTQGIFWFMHISDSHIDTAVNLASDNLELALTDVLDVIDPVYVFVTGDLTDGSVLSIPTSGQVQEEWDHYGQILAVTGMKPSFYFDLPGNHDTYSDQGLTFWGANSLQGQANGGKLFVDATHQTALGEYYFVGLNSSGTWGKPLTFGNPEFTNVADLKAGLQAHKSAQLVFAFAHHHMSPHGTTALQMELGFFGDDGPPVNAQEVSSILAGAGAFYFHGHVHQLKQSIEAGLVAHQISKMSGDGVVDRSSEKAYADTMYHANIGVGIVDHNAFIYRGTALTEPWPMVAITAPVDMWLLGGGQPPESQAGYSWEGDFEPYKTHKNPYAYDVCKDAKDNPVRAVVLSKDPVTEVHALMDGSVISTLTAAADPKGLWVGEMDTTTLSAGDHHLVVIAKTAKSSREDSIWVHFTDGPCVAALDGGVDAEGGSGGSGGSAGTGGAAGSAGKAGAAGWDGGEQEDACSDCGPIEQPVQDSGGCSCLIGGSRGSFASPFAVFGAAIACMLRRARRS